MCRLETFELVVELVELGVLDFCIAVNVIALVVMPDGAAQVAEAVFGGHEISEVGFQSSDFNSLLPSEIRPLKSAVC